MKVVMFFIMLFTSSVVFAAAEQTGVVDELYVDVSGNVAIKLDSNFSSAASNECPTNIGWAGISRTNYKVGNDEQLKLELREAKRSGLPITVVFSSCTAEGAWIQIVGVYVR